MKKNLKFISFGLTLFFILISSVSAKEVTTYADLKVCLEDTSKSTCKLANDITPLDADETTITISSEKTLDLNTKTLTMLNSLIVSQNAKLTITGNGKIISETAGILLYAKAGSTLDITNGTIINETASGRALYIKGDDGNLKTNVIVRKDAKLSANYTLMIASSDKVKAKSKGIVLDLYGNLTALVENKNWEYGGLAIYVNGSIAKSSENNSIVNIHNGSVIEGKKGPAIYAAGYVIWNIEEATITGAEALSIKAGKFSINKATLKAFGEYVKPEDVKYEGNGTEASGAAISITSNGNSDGYIELTLKDIKAISEKGYALFEKNTCDDNTQVDELLIESGEFTGLKGSIYLTNEFTNFIQTGKFNTEVSQAYLKTNSVQTKINNKYYVNIARTIEIKNSLNGTVTLKNVIKKAISEQTIDLTIKASEGYFLKNIKIINKNNQTQYSNTTKETFLMPDYDIIIEPEFQKYQNINESGNLITTEPTLEINSNISNDLTNSLGQVKTDETLMEAIDLEKISVAANDLVEVKIETKLENIEEKDDKISLVFKIKPIYSINGQEQGILANEMLNGKKIKIKLPVPNNITDTYAKVIHKNENGKIISEEEYEIKTDGENKYIELETTSFSEFIVNFYTPENTPENIPEIENPQTLDALSVSVITFLISLMILSISLVIIKNKKITNN